MQQLYSSREHTPRAGFLSSRIGARTQLDLDHRPSRNHLPQSTSWTVPGHCNYTRQERVWILYHLDKCFLWMSISRIIFLAHQEFKQVLQCNKQLLTFTYGLQLRVNNYAGWGQWITTQSEGPHLYQTDLSSNKIPALALKSAHWKHPPCIPFYVPYAEQVPVSNSIIAQNSLSNKNNQQNSIHWAPKAKSGTH